MYVDPDSVVDKESFKLIKSNVICSICTGIIVSPIQCTNCENTFCETCIEEWSNKPGNECPFRCKNPKYKSSRTINNILSNLTFKCQNGCNEIIPYSELEKHYNDKCPKLNVDYKSKYIEYKNKYDILLKKYNELEKQFNEYKSNKDNSSANSGVRKYNFMTETFQSKYHLHELKDATNDENDWICDLCKTEYNKKTEGRYRCKKCDFDICVKCKIIEESGYKFGHIFMSKFHTHILQDKTFDDSNWMCNECRKNYPKKSIKRFCCQKCNYDLCNNCKIKEELTNNFNDMSLV